MLEVEGSHVQYDDADILYCFSGLCSTVVLIKAVETNYDIWE